MIHIAMLSKWHVHAEDYAREIQEKNDISIKMVWDEKEERGMEWAQELKVPFEKNLNTVIESPSIDAVVVNAPTTLHKSIILAAARAKKHIFTEKILALTVEDCNEIIAEIEKNDVKLMISLPRLTKDFYLYTHKMLEGGYIGSLTMIRSRHAHAKAMPIIQQKEGGLPTEFFDKTQSGGGAFIDIGAHPVYMANRLAGTAKTVMANLQTTDYFDVDVNAVVLVEYQSGVLGVLEASFLSKGSNFQLELYGTEGVIKVERDQVWIKSHAFDIDDWMVAESLPDSLSTPMEQWIQEIKENTAPAITLDDAINLTVINEAATLSHQEGRKVTIDENFGGYKNV